MLNTHAVRLNDASLRVKSAAPRPEKNWISEAIKGLRSGQEAQHTYARLRARGATSPEATRKVVDALFSKKS